MPTYYSRSGFHIVIERPLLSNFTGVISKDETEFETITILTNDVYLTETGTYTFEFSNETSSDPTAFDVLDYDTGESIAIITFPLTDPLVLVAGIDGESGSDLSIIYPLRSFSLKNQGEVLTWVCTPLSVGSVQEASWESLITDLEDPKIIGNLTGCITGEYQGDITQEKTCESETEDEVFLFEIREKVSGDLIYSRVECCCPTVTPGNPPGFVCTCPDWGKATSYNQTLFSSSVRLREWVLSNAGARADCKHIMAAKRIMGIDQPIYTDPPYSAPPPPPTPG
jgi:hypothetical protein